MRSRANIKSHPLHPILVCFPIAFFSGTLVFDLLSWIFSAPALANTAHHLSIAGICTALLAAIPGLIDYLYTVPPKSSASKRGARHGLLNVLMLMVFISVAVFYKDLNLFVRMGLETAGFAILCSAGWMGGTLVHRNQIGVDIRYADAGKWNEETIEDGAKDLEVKVSDLRPGQMKLVAAFTSSARFSSRSDPSRSFS